ncbi:hypothetical protein OROGR_029506 [Orobanche gracilis]
MPQMGDKYQLHVMVAAFTLHNFMRMCKPGIPLVKHNVVQGKVDSDLLNVSRKNTKNMLRHEIALMIGRSIPGNIELEADMHQEDNMKAEESL